VRTGLLHSEAREYCKKQNGGLVSISSEEEQTFLHKTLIDPDTEGQYMASSLSYGPIEKLACITSLHYFIL
jgi:hypothetical protein